MPAGTHTHARIPHTLQRSRKQKQERIPLLATASIRGADPDAREAGRAHAEMLQRPLLAASFIPSAAAGSGSSTSSSGTVAVAIPAQQL
jgi:hypothetical protein